MPKKVSNFKKVSQRMLKIYAEENNIDTLVKDMGITRRRYNQCLKDNQIPYKGIMNWCLKHGASLDKILLEEKKD